MRSANHRTFPLPTDEKWLGNMLRLNGINLFPSLSPLGNAMQKTSSAHSIMCASWRYQCWKRRSSITCRSGSHLNVHLTSANQLYLIHPECHLFSQWYHLCNNPFVARSFCLMQGPRILICAGRVSFQLPAREPPRKVTPGLIDPSPIFLHYWKAA